MVQSVVIVVLAVLLVCLSAYCLGKLAFRKDDAKETRHKAYIKLASALEGYGLKSLPKILIDVAVDDYSGAYEQVKFWVKLMEMDPNAVVKEFDEVFDRVLTQKLSVPESLALIKAKIAEVEAPKA